MVNLEDKLAKAGASRCGLLQMLYHINIWIWILSYSGLICSLFIALVDTFVYLYFHLIKIVISYKKNQVKLCWGLWFLSENNREYKKRWCNLKFVEAFDFHCRHFCFHQLHMHKYFSCMMIQWRYDRWSPFVLLSFAYVAGILLGTEMWSWNCI